MTCSNVKAVVIGGSAGSFQVVSQILSELPKKIKFPIILCLHRLKHVREGFVEALALKSNIPIVEPNDKEKIKPGIAYLAPANYHMYIEISETIALSTEEMINYSRPAIDITLGSAGYVYRDKLVGIILSGANRDGANGLKKIKDYGGYVIVQDPLDCSVPTMPNAAKAVCDIDETLTIEGLIMFLNKLN